MNIIIENRSKIRDIVKEYYSTSKVFKKYGIDFYCGGNKTLEEVSIFNKISLEQLKNELTDQIIQANPGDNPNFKHWSTGFLTDFIIRVHHNYIKSNVAVITEHIDESVKKCKKDYQRFTTIKTLFEEMADELLTHLTKEEDELFPYIKELSFAVENKLSLNRSKFGVIKNPVRVMEFEHENTTNILKQIRKTSQDFSIDNLACDEGKKVYGKLIEFEENMQQHVHLENNILFPKVIELEKILNEDSK